MESDFFLLSTIVQHSVRPFDRLSVRVSLCLSVGLLVLIS